MNKKIVFALLMCIISAGIKAQNIPNGGFETWMTMGPFETVQGWIHPPVVSKSTDMHSGTYAVMLKTDTFYNPQTMTLDTIAGFCSTGTPGMGPGNPGISGYVFTDRPDSLTGWFKYAPALNDSFYISVYLSFWDPFLNAQESIAYSSFLGGASASYTRFSFPLNYSSPNSPDTAIIFMRSSNPSNAAQNFIGSQLLVDDLAFVTNTINGIESATSNQKLNLNVAPNPACDFIRVNLSKQVDGPIEVTLTDLLGRTVYTNNFGGEIKSFEINTNVLFNGHYVLRLRYNEEIISKKISIIK